MELSSEEGEIPMPLNSTYGGHMIHHDPTTTPHNHIIIPSNSTAPQQIPSNGPPIVHTIVGMELDDPSLVVPYNNNNNKKQTAAARYKECLKNHAATMGGNATDGCGEFMPSGEDGTLEALTCSACNCHRNFHRKEVEGDQQQPNSSCHDFYHHSSSHLNRVGRRVILGHHKNILAGPESLGGGYHHPTAGTIIPSRVAPPHHQMIMSYNMGGSLPSESDEQEDGGGGGMVLARPPHHHQLLKKRFRTKFTQEQKEKMMSFAEKVGWKIQKQEESVVQQFCQEIGVKRRVLKVWMHNNKHNLAKNNPSSSA